jgi:hypothetical protein
MRFEAERAALPYRVCSKLLRLSRSVGASSAVRRGPTEECAGVSDGVGSGSACALRGEGREGHGFASSAINRASASAISSRIPASARGSFAKQDIVRILMMRCRSLVGSSSSSASMSFTSTRSYCKGGGSGLDAADARGERYGPIIEVGTVISQQSPSGCQSNCSVPFS